MRNKGLIITVTIALILGVLIFALNTYSKSIERSQTITNENNNKNKAKNIQGKNLKYGNEVGNIAPDFTLKDVSGNVVTLSKFRGKKVILDFWATTCPYCKIEMPELNRFIKNHKKDTVLLAVDLGEDISKVKDYLNGRGYEFTVLLDSELKTAYDYKVQFIPMSYFIDKDGVIRVISNGAMTYDEIEEYYKSIS